MSVRYLEPGTVGPAEQDWSTALILAANRQAATVLGWFLGALPVAVAALVLLPATTANVAAVAVLALLGLFGAIGPAMVLADRRRHRRRLLARPWRRQAVDVAVQENWYDTHQLTVTGERPVVLTGYLPEARDLVLRHGEVFLVGPDESGRALMRVAGLCRTYPMKIDTAEARQVASRDTQPDAAPDPRALRGLRRWRRCWAYPAAVGVIGAVLVALGLIPSPSPLALVVGGLFVLVAAVAVPVTVPIARYHGQALAAAEAATAWTSLPITLFPWEPTDVVAGLVQTGTGAALVQFPMPDLDVVANLADTGTIWIRGTPGEVIAVGAPGLPVLTFGLLQADRDKPPDEPQPWLLRANDPGLARIPALRR